MSTAHVEHPDHAHVHGDGCGHVALPHGDHVDYAHDGHLHTAHDGHYDECTTDVHTEHAGHDHVHDHRRRRRRPTIDAPMTAASPDGLPRLAPQERSTRQKRALAAVLDTSEGFRSAQELHAELQARGENVALTTVYNQVRALADAGELDALRGDDGETRYRRCASDEHHHHLVCRRCGSAVEVEGPEVERWATETGDRHGFSDVTHTVEILGTCPDCAAATMPAEEAPG
jgi:Fur family transcriptional regulator, ferric uptake regulator